MVKDTRAATLSSLNKFGSGRAQTAALPRVPREDEPSCSIKTPLESRDRSDGRGGVDMRESRQSPNLEAMLVDFVPALIKLSRCQ